jgi:hypothetical protein
MCPASAGIADALKADRSARATRKLRGAYYVLGHPLGLRAAKGLAEQER